ncbi:MAG TPA: hypothetical protein VF616_20735 [Duganella sp.]|uniref:hypothetical protein n=1 Tax=Duganella sp. TaxID=1904440 RepID=UPI002ED0618A
MDGQSQRHASVEGQKIKPHIISIPIALITFAASVVALQGGFSGGQSQCGDFGFGCMGIAVVILVIGTLIGLVAALTGLIRMRGRSWCGWIGLLLNGLPALVLAGWLAQVAMAH